jgi:LPS sulfotransferase NodH
MHFKEIVKSYLRKLKNIWYGFFGHKSYEKFVIVTSGRYGSNFLVSLLDSHENIEASGELFRYLDGDSSLKRWNEIFGFKNRNTQIAGFKLFYFHPFDENDAEVWNILQSDKEIKIIHLVRENKIRVYVSLMVATKTGEWKRKSGKSNDINDKRIEIDFEDFINWIEEKEQFEFDTRNRFKNHPFIEISYENLVGNRESVFEDLLSFLNVSKMKLHSPLKKQNKETLEDLILNYQEFKENILQTKYAKYLQDN